MEDLHGACQNCFSILNLYKSVGYGICGVITYLGADAREGMRRQTVNIVNILSGSG